MLFSLFSPVIQAPRLVTSTVRWRPHPHETTSLPRSTHTPLYSIIREHTVPPLPLAKRRICCPHRWPCLYHQRDSLLINAAIHFLKEMDCCHLIALSATRGGHPHHRWARMWEEYSEVLCESRTDFIHVTVLSWLVMMYEACVYVLEVSRTSASTFCCLCAYKYDLSKIFDVCVS